MVKGKRPHFGKTFRRSALLGGCGICALINAPVASAQTLQEDEQAEASGAHAEIVVTATFREERLQDTPIAITAVTGDMLEARSQTNVFEVARQTPSLTLAPQGQAFGSTMLAFMRGVGQSDFILALEPGVGIYVDDVYHSTITGSLIDLLDVERIEVLRGPQGTLAGRNSIGGAIKLFSRKPDGEGSGLVSLTYGSYDRFEARALANFALVPDQLFVRISGLAKSSDGFVKREDYACSHPGSGVPGSSNLADGCKLGTLGGKSLAAGRAYVRWLPSNDVEVELIGDVTRDKSEAGADVLRYANNPRLTIDDGNPATPVVPYDCRFVPYGPNSCDPLGSRRYVTYSTFTDPTAPTSQMPFTPLSLPIVSHLDGVGLSGKLTWNISDTFELKSISAYRQYKAVFSEDADGSPIPGQTVLQTVKLKQWSQELRLNGSLLDDKLDFTLGGFWFRGDGTFSARLNLRYIGLDFNQGPEATPNRSTAIFLNTSYELSDQLRLSGGIRQTWDKKDQEYVRRHPDGSPIAIPCLPGLAPFDPANAPNCALFGLDGLEDGYKGNRTDWRAALDFRVSDAVMVYGQVATGYRAGGVNPRPFFGPGTILPVANGQIDPVAGVPTDVNQLKSFGPETIVSYEVGAKTDFFDRRLRLNVAAFYNDYDDIILNVLSCPISPCFQPNNVGSARVKGLEAEMGLYPTGRLSMDLSASFLDFDYKRTDQAATGISPDMVTPFTPRTKISGGIGYDVYQGKLGNLNLRLDGSYQSKVYAEAINRPSNQIDGYFLANARVSWTSPAEDWIAALEVTNLGNRYYELTRFDQSAQSGTVSATPGAPRQWAFSLTRKF